MRQILLSLSLFQAGLMLSFACHAEGYELGQGWQAGSYYFSGYTNIKFKKQLNEPAKLELDDLSLFVSGHINQGINPFIEVEVSDHTLVQKSGERENGQFAVERFYNDVILSERNTLRAGKMLTPLGGWNVVHAAPLMNTVTRPCTTALGFHAYVSGISWLHESEGDAIPDFQLYLQPGNEWFKRPEEQAHRNFRNVAGGHISKSFSLTDKIGASFQHGHLIETGERFTLYGINANKSFGKLRLESEAITSHFTGSVLAGASPRIHSNETGIFVLADYSITSQWHGLVEWERYQDHTAATPSRNTLLGIAYRPRTPMVWKLEYVYQAGEPVPASPIITGWKAAFSLMF